MTGPRHRKTNPALAATLGAAIFFPAVVAQAQTPSLPSTCAIVATYEPEHDHTFIDVFDAMVFTRNDCLWEDGSVAPCDFETLRRWSGAFNLHIPRLRSWTDNAAKAKSTLRALDTTMSVVLPGMGLTLQELREFSKEKRPTEPTVMVLIGTQSELFRYAADLDGVIPGQNIERIARLNADGGAACSNQMLMLCRVSNAKNRGFAFIDIDLPPEQVASCMKEQVFKLFVPGDPPGGGLFDDPWQPLEDFSIGARYSLRDVAVVNLLHSEALRNGMPRADALAEAKRILADCP